LRVDHNHQVISLDRWIRFRAPAKVSLLIRELRKELDTLLKKKIENPQLDIYHTSTIQIILKLIEKEGLL
jgi:ATP-dependent RNA helicase DHX57